MKKNKPARLYPEKGDITIQNFLLEDKNLLTLVILIVFIFFFIIGCIFCIDGFRGENVYNAIGCV